VSVPVCLAQKRVLLGLWLLYIMVPKTWTIVCGYTVNLMMSVVFCEWKIKTALCLKNKNRSVLLMCLLNLILLFSEFSHFKYLCFSFSWHLLILFKKSLTATWRWRSVWSGRSSCDLPFKTSMSKVASSSRLSASWLVSLIFAFDFNRFYCTLDWCHIRVIFTTLLLFYRNKS